MQRFINFFAFVCSLKKHENIFVRFESEFALSVEENGAVAAPTVYALQLGMVFVSHKHDKVPLAKIFGGFVSDYLYVGAGCVHNLYARFFALLEHRFFCSVRTDYESIAFFKPGYVLGHPDTQ